MIDSVAELVKQAEAELLAAKTRDAIEAVRIKFLGRKGLLTSLLRNLGEIPPTERPHFGKRLNEAKENLAAQIDRAISGKSHEEKDDRLAQEWVDVTLPGREVIRGTIHPVTQVLREVCSILSGLGFSIVEGPEVELDWYNFEALNLPKDHPTRDMQDTFYIEDNIVLRTHTSPVQIRVMEKQKPPVRIVSPGRVYRPDSDVSHTPMFHQIEGLLVDRRITFGDLKGVLTTFIHGLFGENTAVRFRTSFFPFTEPSAEVDIRCIICHGKGCRVCSQSGWLEILGSGMVDPEVFRNVGYDPEEVSGFAFGAGIERMAMLKYGISDIRLFFENNKRFLLQF
jgi:phenylalanyl-tRNA synthetase alpha chain